MVIKRATACFLVLSILLAPCVSGLKRRVIRKQAVLPEDRGYNNAYESETLDSAILPVTTRGQRPLGVVIFTCCTGDQEKDSLLDSLLSLKKFIFEEHDYYPILLLNDGTITASDLAKYRRVMNPSLILEERMSLDVPAYLKYRMPPLRIPEHLFGRTVKERSLCRYRAGEFLRIGVLQSFDWFMLMEPGVRILDAFSFDPFVFMESEQLDYGYAASGFDAVETTAGLWDLTQEYFLHEDLPFAIPERVAHIASGSDYDRSTIYPAFEIAKMSALRSKLMYKFFSYIDWSGGFYSKGYCAPAVRQLQISGFLHPDRIHHFRTLPIQYGPFLSPPLGFTEEEVQRLRKKYSEKYGLVFGPDEHPLFAIAV